MNYFEASKMFLFLGIQTVALFIWIDRYIDYRLKQKLSRKPMPDHRSFHFRIVGPVIFALMNVMTLTSFIHNSNWFLSIEPNDWFRFLGVLLVAGAAFLYRWAARSRLVSYFHGPYGYIRHPIYFANIIMGLGLCFASGSIWIFLMCIYGSFELVMAMNREEAYLRTEFPQFATYSESTKRIVPFVF